MNHRKNSARLLGTALVLVFSTTAIAAKPGRARQLNGEFERDGAHFSTKAGVANAGGFVVFGRTPFEDYKFSAEITLAKRGYSHGGLVFGFIPPNDAQVNAENATLYLVTLHGGEGDCSVALFDGAANGKMLQSQKVPTCRGQLEVDVRTSRRGAVEIRFGGKRILESRLQPKRLGEGYVGLRAGTSLGETVQFHDVDID